jgi:hypothetical protein
MSTLTKSIAVGVVLAVATALVIGGVTLKYFPAGVKSVTQTSSQNLTQQINTSDVTSAYLALLESLNVENATALASEFENNATVQILGGNPSTFAGLYVGSANISAIYQFMLSSRDGFASVNLANETHTISFSASGNQAVVVSNFTMYGNDTAFSYRIEPGSAVSAYVTNVNLQLTYVHQGNDWFISKETWNFTSFELHGF